MEVALVVGVVAGLVTVYSLVARYFPVYEETAAFQRQKPESPRLEKTPAVGD
jgi:hypothetical protein